MSFFMSWGEYLGKQVDNIQDYSQSLADATKDFVCETWNDYPDFITQNQSIPISMVRGLLKNVCTTSPPDPPVPPECAPQYHIYGTYVSKNFSAGGCDVEAYWRTRSPIAETEIASTSPVNGSNGFMAIPGQSGAEYSISRISSAQYAQNDTSETSATNRIVFREETQSCLNVTVPGHGHNFLPAKIIQTNIIPPSCNDDIVYPPSSPPPIINKLVQIQEGDTTNTYNIEIVNELGGGFSFPVTVNFGGQVNVTLDLGGFTFNSGGGNDSGNGGNGDNGEDAPPPIIVSPPDVSVTIPFIPQFNPDESDEEVEEDVEDTTVTIPEDVELQWVLIEISTLPKAGKTILLPDSENNIYFAGYFSWVVDDGIDKYYLPQEPIRRIRNAFSPPDGVVGYNVFAVNGAKLTVKKYTQIVEA
jgi:hypothetical protein